MVKVRRLLLVAVVVFCLPLLASPKSEGFQSLNLVYKSENNPASLSIVRDSGVFRVSCLGIDSSKIPICGGPLNKKPQLIEEKVQRNRLALQILENVSNKDQIKISESKTHGLENELLPHLEINGRLIPPESSSLKC